VTIGFSAIRTPLLGSAPNIVVGTVAQLLALMLVWGIIKVRPLLATSLEQYDSAWGGGAPTTSPDMALQLEQQAASLDVRIAQAEAQRGLDLLR